MKKLILALLLNPLLFGALSTNTVWEVRTAGADTNGGAFVTGASGTDYSQNNNKNAAACTNCGSSTANLSTADVVATGVATVTSATATFSAAAVGNVIFLIGTGITTGWYQVVTFTNVTTVILDRSPGTGTATSGIGGALLTPQQMATNLVSGNTAYFKAGTYTVTTTVTMPANTSWYNIIGYSSSRGDNGQATITSSTNGVALITYGTTNQTLLFWRNFIFSSTAGTRGYGFTDSGGGYFGSAFFYNCTFTGLKDAWHEGTGSFVAIPFLLYFQDCNITGSTNIGIELTTGQTPTLMLVDTIVQGSTGDGITKSGGQIYYVLIRSIIYNNGGKGINSSNSSPNFYYVFDSVIASNVSDGIANADNTAGASNFTNFFAENTIFYANGGWGININTTGLLAFNLLNNCFFFNNTSGKYTSPITNSQNEVVGTANPFVSIGTNFALNNTAGGGAAARAAGFPGALLAGGTGFLDIGALQHQGGGAVGIGIIQ